MQDAADWIIFNWVGLSNTTLAFDGLVGSGSPTDERAALYGVGPEVCRTEKLLEADYYSNSVFRPFFCQTDIIITSMLPDTAGFSARCTF